MSQGIGPPGRATNAQAAALPPASPRLGGAERPGSLNGPAPPLTEGSSGLALRSSRIGDHNRVSVIRTALVLAAVACCAWFAIGIHQAHDVAAATGIIDAGRSAGSHELAIAAGDLRSAEFLNPDQEVNILRGHLAILRGDDKQAQEILAAVTRAEPMNLEAWIWFTGANLGNARQARIGTARLDQLDPIDTGHARP